MMRSAALTFNDAREASMYQGDRLRDGSAAGFIGLSGAGFCPTFGTKTLLSPVFLTRLPA